MSIIASYIVHKTRSKGKWVNKFNSMVTLYKMIILRWLFIALQFPLVFMTPNIMTEQKGKEYQEIRAIEAFEYDNTRSDFKCYDDLEKLKTTCETTVTIPGTQGAFSDKVAPDIDDFTDEPEFQCDAQVVKNTCR